MEEQWIKDLREFVCEPPDPLEFISACVFVGEKHPLFGIPRTQKQKQVQSEKITNWWKNLSDNEKELIKTNISKSVKSQWDLLTPEERKKARKWNPNPKKGKDNPNYGKVSANRGKIWITNGENNMMVNQDEIPEGWYKGRVNVISNQGKERLRNLTTQRNRNGELGWTVRKVAQDPLSSS